MRASATKKMAKLEARRARADLGIRALVAQERERKRREDARAKILLGGALLALFRNEPIAARALTPRLLPLIAERDRELVARLFGSGE